MLPAVDHRTEIQTALAGFSSLPLADAARTLFATLPKPG
jgi:hypothetical protein